MSGGELEGEFVLEPSWPASSEGKATVALPPLPKLVSRLPAELCFSGALFFADACDAIAPPHTAARQANSSTALQGNRDRQLISRI
jgi:hypothetical protein